jgi:acetyl-CoA C-acetyltransferase
VSLAPRWPVLVGVGSVNRPEPPAEAIELMVTAVERAVDDAGDRRLLDRVGWIGVPEGSWSYVDPGRLLATRLGLTDVHTVRADVGRTQQELIARACQAVLDDGVDVALVVGGEAKHRQAMAARAGEAAAETLQPADAPPDEVLAPGSLGILDVEIVRNTVVPATAYALCERALAAAEGWSPAEHRDRLAGLYGRFAAVAAANPDAWDRSGPSGAAIVEPGEDNRMVATPYTKRLCSQWNVDQAAALLITSVETASSLGIPRDRWVFPRSSAVVNVAVPVPARAELHRSAGARAAGAAALASAGVGLDEVGFVDLYSCFPVAVQVHAAELGLPIDGSLTQTGGMSFAGGPLNNYVLQAMVRIAGALRADDDAIGLSTSVSAFLSKHGVGVWSSAPPTAAFVGHEVAAADEALDVDAELVGPARIVASTVVGDRAVAVVQADDRPVRSIAESHDDAVVDRLRASPGSGWPVVVGPGGDFELVSDDQHM